MAERPRASASGRAHPSAPPVRTPPPAVRHSSGTARVSTLQGVRRTELPGWFWGALGCLTVLVVGLTIVFVMGQGTAPTPPAVTAGRASEAPAAPPAAAAVPAPAAAAPAPEAPPAPAMKIEPMAAPPPAAVAPPPAAPAAHAAK